MKLLSLAALTLLVGCSPQGETSKKKAASSGEVNLYTSRHYDTDLALYANFTKQTGIKVNQIEAKADALIERIVAEGEYGKADIFVTVDAGRLWRAEQAGILDGSNREVLNQAVPAHFRHPDGLWYGISKRARVIIYNKAAGRPSQLDGYLDLAHPSNKGKVCIRSSSNIYNTSLLASLIHHHGQETAQN